MSDPQKPLRDRMLALAGGIHHLQGSDHLRRAAAKLFIEAVEAMDAMSCPEGWKLVPAEITPDMQRAYFDVIDKNLWRVETDPRFGRHDSNAEAYRAMIAAAPKPSLT